LKDHACKKCNYYYDTLCNDSSAPIYDALMDAIRTVTVERMRPCCGYNPGGVILDNEAPRCKDFEEDECAQ